MLALQRQRRQTGFVRSSTDKASRGGQILDQGPPRPGLGGPVRQSQQIGRVDRQHSD
jgi:hypothetical protein